MASSPLDLRASRLLRASRDTFDVVVLGGGAFGAAAARSAAHRGLRTLLLEARDFSAGTSSRSSKLLHGGVRYLEQGDLSLVFEALAERSVMLETAPHLTRSARFVFPILKGKTRPLWQVRCGLGIYDLLAGVAGWRRGTRALPPHTLLRSNDTVAKRLQDLGMSADGLLEYSDGQVDDARIVVENVLDAEELGATVLNHARCEGLRRQPSGGWQICWRDTCSQVMNESFARSVVNATGAGVVKVHEQFEKWPSTWPTPQLTRGTHLLFDVALGLPPLILPTGEAGRYYFVLPHFAPGREVTLVGTTDVPVESGEQGEEPSQAEIDELLGFVARDLPKAGLDLHHLFAKFAGTRVLVAAKTNGRTSRLRRSELFLERPGYVAVLGGKYTTARLIGERLVDRIDRQSGRPLQPLRSTATRALPGSVDFDRDRVRVALREALGAEIPPEEIERAIARFGSRAIAVLEYLDEGERVASASEKFYRAQIRYAICVEHALEVDDVIDRRLSLWPSSAERTSDAAVIEEEFQRLGLYRVGKRHGE